VAARCDAAEQQFGNLRIIRTASYELFSRQNAVTVLVQFPHYLDHLTQVDVVLGGLRRSSIRVQRLHSPQRRGIWDAEAAAPNLCSAPKLKYLTNATFAAIIFAARCTSAYSTVLRLHVVVRQSACPSVTLVDQDHTGWKTWILIARTTSPTPSLFVAERPSTYSQRNMRKFGGD